MARRKKLFPTHTFDVMCIVLMVYINGARVALHSLDRRVKLKMKWSEMVDNYSHYITTNYLQHCRIFVLM